MPPPPGGTGAPWSRRCNPSALAAAAVAKQGPLLLTASEGLDSRVQTELQRVLPAGSTVYLLGGTGALSQAVQDRVQAMGYNPVRLFGSNRFETAVAVADQGLGNPS